MLFALADAHPAHIASAEKVQSGELQRPEVLLSLYLDGGQTRHRGGHQADEAPGQTALLLQGKQRLRPDDIVGQAQTRLKTDRPLMFLNACRVGAGGLALTGLGGWAKVMAQDCGVGALVAPMWDVDDVLARRFAGMFYEAVKRMPGCTVAQAIAEARRIVRQSHPHDPAWLAYSVYGHPNARVVLG